MIKEIVYILLGLGIIVLWVAMVFAVFGKDGPKDGKGKK